MPESFGARLRQRREQQHVSLDAIAEQTKIKSSLLDGLERGDVSHWPSGIFRRAFVRAYAHSIALDPDVVVREFLELYPDPVEDVATLAAGEQAAESSPARDDPPTRFRFLVGSMLGSLSRRRREPDPVPNAAVDQVPPSVQTPPVAIVTTSAAVLTPPTPVVATPAPLMTQNKAERPVDIDLAAAAHLCTEIGRAERTHDMKALLEKAAGVLDAVGLIIWVWDPQASALTPTMAHGYSDQVLAQLPRVGRDAPNATASAFRSARTCAVDGGGCASGALAVPLITPNGCAGVLAVELPRGRERRESVRALVTIFAAVLATRFDARQQAERRNRKLA